MFVRQALRLFGGVAGTRLLSLLSGRSTEVGTFSPRIVIFDLLPDRFNRSMSAKKAVAQRLVFAQQPEKQVLSLDIRRSELARLVAGKRKLRDGPFLYSARTYLGPRRLGTLRQVRSNSAPDAVRPLFRTTYSAPRWGAQTDCAIRCPWGMQTLYHRLAIQPTLVAARSETVASHHAML